MKALFIYRFLTRGGVEAVLATRLRGLKKWGIDAQAWFLFDGPGRSLFRGVLDQVHIGSTKALSHYMESKRFAIISILDTPEVFPVLNQMPHAPKFILEVHSPYSENLHYLKSLRMRRMDALFVPSQFQASVVQSRLRKKVAIRVVPNPVGEAFVGQLSNFSPMPERPIVAWLGRLDRLKNWTEFIAIAGQLTAAGSMAQYWMLGRGSEEKVAGKLVRLAQRQGILDSLRWFRGVDQEHIPRVLDAVRTSGGVVVSTSKGDSFGMTIAEAMARGCAVVVPAEGPFREFVTSGEHGFDYPLGDAAQAAQQIKQLLEKEPLRRSLGENGRTSIVARHGPQVALGVLAGELKKVYTGAE